MSTSSVLPASVLALLNGTSGSSASSASGASAATGSVGGSTGGGSLSQLDFLNLMMQQLKNQDPTKPMDQSAIMGQLAQFGTVTGINQLNTSFSNLSAQLVSNQALQASSLLGHNVLVPGSTAPLAAGGTVAGGVTVPANANNVTVQVVDASGAVVRTIALGSPAAGVANFTWDGKTDAGQAAAAGTYGIVAAANVSGQGQQLATLVSAPVTSITLNGSGGGLTLHLAGLGDVPFSSVQQIN
ncbi:MAG: flagellar hook assembly protein FlgD [Proteobacteria bacterium]|nr:flagellar hook assembly protein FlgD [Pseudomonadota bacterium]